MLSEIVRGALLTKESDPSFVEAHKVLLSEPTHVEDEVEDQEDEVEYERDCEECKMGVEERSDTQSHETWVT